MTEEKSVKYEIIDDETSMYEESTEKSTIKRVPSEDTVPFKDRIENFIKENKPKLYILTPCFASQCFINYVVCLMATVESFRNAGFPLQIEFCRNDSLVSRARNNLVARAMTDPECTHILFIDNDISWDPIDIFKLILSDKDIIGGIYPLKTYHWNTITKNPGNPYETNLLGSLISKKNASQLKDVISDEEMVQYNLLKYNVNYLDPYLKIDKNCAKVRHIATGFMMIKRGTIEKMQKAFPSTKYVDDVSFLRGSENDNAYALFDCGVENGHYYSEDWMFCDRWAKMEGEIYVDVTISLTHTGIEDYRGCYLSTII